MSRHAKYIIPILLLSLILLIGGFIAVPRVVGALPGEYRLRLARIPLMEALIEAGVTPLPAALPAPSIVVRQPRVSIPTLASPTSTATSEPTATQVSEQTSASPESVELSMTPTVIPSPTATATPRPLPKSARIEGLKIVPQGFNNCGPANLTINLNFYGEVTTQNEAAAILKPNREDRNVSPWQLSDYVNEHTTLRSTAHSGGDLEMVKRFVANGFPIVIEKGYEPTAKDGWLGHYFTIFGYDDEKQELYGMDTYLGPWDDSGRAESYETVEFYWQQFNYTFFVVYPPEQAKLVSNLLGSELLDPATMWQYTAQRAQAQIEKDPENAFAWFNLGTSLTRLGEMTGEAEFYENSAAAFDQARILGIPPRIVWYQFGVYTAYMKVGRYQDMLDLADSTLTTQGGRNVEETYLYKGHALALQGDALGAIEAYEQAIRLNENFYPAQWALDSITGG
ncbi:MAG TPA: C39 family peptidase [candidate division Zixibacteria bacterium]|nr:C39 family peptidase [candidate division Zixibacteria bacterium]